MKRPLLRLTLTALLQAAVVALPAASMSRPNIVLMMADDQGWGETGYNGHPQVKTPVLDEMSRTALRLDRFYAASPVCSPTRASVPCVTSDILPTVLDLLGLKHPAPQRPLDGISLRALIVDGAMSQRPSPIGFWKYSAVAEKKNGRWVSEELSRGTTPTTRNPAIDFTNYKHPVAKTSDFGGDAAWTDNRFKLVMGQARRGAARTELYDLIADPKETKDIAAQHPEVVKRMTGQLENWQRSVERSLSGADY